MAENPYDIYLEALQLEHPYESFMAEDYLRELFDYIWDMLSEEQRRKVLQQAVNKISMIKAKGKPSW